ncbi:CDP-alcohol phosphatidyltransferase [Zafaria cholistanensis]|uniref:Phosphatidylinositol phosphate synthase n=1 Tax=Zafaria cholistanensis TaxID=1682741 RepID=A0A5A7NN41_9MICC|nr:CDP-alcohol phosphatidyltransferase family protein [Zafaria cholistanensis]GER22210.1 CDP-alcohol phosphatidyltransferase [Zafaria cholistanensis]
MLNRYARGICSRVFTPLARWLVARGVSPDAVTVVGTLGAVAGALVFYPVGELFWGTVFIVLFIFSDVVDGLMARLPEAGPRGDARWGSFLDSTLDRVADSAIFAGVMFWFFTGGDNPAIGVAAGLCLVLGNLVSYARAKAESLGYDANTGLAERGERLVVALTFTGLAGLGLNEWVLFTALGLLALASAVTAVQRIMRVRRQALQPLEG